MATSLKSIHWHPWAVGRGAHWYTSTQPELPKPEPVTVTCWSSTRSADGSTESVGGVTTVSGSKATGAVPDLPAT